MNEDASDVAGLDKPSYYFYLNVNSPQPHQLGDLQFLRAGYFLGYVKQVTFMIMVTIQAIGQTIQFRVWKLN